MLTFLTDPVAAPSYDWSALDLSGITSNFFAVVPVAIGVVLALVAFRKAWGFVMGQIKRA